MAVVVLVMITAWEALFDRAKLQAGETVLIHAGAGGVGHVAIQIAVQHGARVATTVSSREKADYVSALGAEKVINYQQFNIPKRLWQSLVKYSLNNLDKIWAEITKKELEKLAIELTRGVYHIQGKGIFKDEFVTCGGIKLKEINFQTMESKICSNLYFAGEILDIDGVTGGFNFQNAWTTSYLAGISVSQKIISNKNINLV